MCRGVGVCSIGHDELTVVLLLRRQRRHATRPLPRFLRRELGDPLMLKEATVDIWSVG
jgi:hypothetical protein